MATVADIFQERIYGTPEFASIHEKRPPFPLIVDVEPTNACNLDCIFCQRQVMERAVKTMPLETYTAIIDEVAANQPCAVRFSGWGEPTMNKHIVDFIRMATERGVLTHLTTNATLLTLELSRALLEAGLTKIKFSLQGLSADEYDRMRVPRVDDDHRTGYANITRNIEEFVALRDELAKECFIQISVSMLRHEQEDDSSRLAFYDRWHDKVDGIWGLGKIGVYGGQPLLTSFQRVKKTGRISEDDLNEGRPMRADDVQGGKGCDELYSKLSVGADGAIKACCDDADNRLVVGWIADMSLKEAWDSEYLAGLRAALESGDTEHIPRFCQTCDNYF
jgi:organic radical activating enzyme